MRCVHDGSFYERKSREYCDSWRADRMPSCGAKVLMFSGDVAKARVDGRIDRLAQRDDDPLPGELAERHGFQCGGGLVFDPAERVGGERGVGGGIVRDRRRRRTRWVARAASARRASRAVRRRPIRATRTIAAATSPSVRFRGAVPRTRGSRGIRRWPRARPAASCARQRSI